MQRSVWMLLLAVAPGPLAAQGFGVYEHNACNMGRAGTGVASPCADGSAVFFNPGALALLPGTHLSGGVTLIMPTGGFTPDPGVLPSDASTDMKKKTYVVPNFYAAHRFGDKLAAGIGVFAPYGLGTEWPTANTCVKDTNGLCTTPQVLLPPGSQDFLGRFSGYNTSLKGIYVQPTVAYQLTKTLGVGLGIDYVWSSVELHQRADLSTIEASPGITFGALGVPAYTDFADAQLKATGTAWTFQVGVHWQAADRVAFGIKYLNQANVTYDGDATFRQVQTGLILPPNNPIQPGTAVPLDLVLAGEFAPGGQLEASSATTAITFPSQLVAGVSFKVMDNWSILLDYQAVHWNSFGTLVIAFPDSTRNITQVEDYKNTSGIRVGTEWAKSDRLSFRAGYLYHTGAAPDYTVTPLLPEGSRNEFTAGASIGITTQLKADLAYQYIHQQDRRGRVTDGPNTGLYSFTANLVGLGLAYTF